MSEEPRHPEFERLTGPLRAEQRAEAQAYEELAAIDLLRGRTLADVGTELLARGDVAAVTFAVVSFTGTVFHVAPDLLCLRIPTGEVDVNLAAPLSLRVVERVASGGLPRAHEPPSFVARLREHEAAGTSLRLGTRVASREVAGRIVAVARDHLLVEDDAGRTAISSSAIDYVLHQPATGT